MHQYYTLLVFRCNIGERPSIQVTVHIYNQTEPCKNECTQLQKQMLRFDRTSPFSMIAKACKLDAICYEESGVAVGMLELLWTTISLAGRI